MSRMIAMCGLVCNDCIASIATQKNDDKLREKEILQPRIIVAVDDDAYNEIRGHFRNVKKVPHYRRAYRWKKTEKMERQLEEISNQL